MRIKEKQPNLPDKVRQLIVTVFGDMGVGTTTFGLTAEKPLLLNCVRGCVDSSLCPHYMDVKYWEDVAMLPEADLTEYKTIVVDTVDELVRLLSYHTQNICDEILPLDVPIMSFTNWELVQNMVERWFQQIKLHGKDIVLLSQSTKMRSDDGRVNIKPHVEGGIAQMVYRESDLIGWFHLVGKERCWSLKHSEEAYAKSPVALEGDIVVPHLDDNPNTLAEIIAQCKVSIEEALEENPEVEKRYQQLNKKRKASKTAIKLANGASSLRLYPPERERFLKRHDFYVLQVNERIFSDLKGKEEETVKQVNQFFNHYEGDENTDPGDVAALAEEYGIEFYNLLSSLRRQTFLGALSSLYFQWEKDFRGFLEQKLRHSYDSEALKLLCWGSKKCKSDISDLFFGLELLGWNLREEPWYEKMDECRLIVNVYKHGGGDAMNTLSCRNPEYFKSSLDSHQLASTLSVHKTHEDLSITQDDFNRIAAAFRKFWHAFPESFVGA